MIYELHVRDFSSDESGNFTLRGKFGAFCEKAVNGFGETIGLDYIKKLGVTHIHLLPVSDYSRWTKATMTRASTGATTR